MGSSARLLDGGLALTLWMEVLGAGVGSSIRLLAGGLALTLWMEEVLGAGVWSSARLGLLGDGLLLTL